MKEVLNTKVYALGALKGGHAKYLGLSEFNRAEKGRNSALKLGVIYSENIKFSVPIHSAC